MRKWIALVCAGLLLAGAAAAIPVGLREYTLRVTDGATTANSFTLGANDVDTTASIDLAGVLWPTDNSKPLGTLLLWFPNTTALQEVIDSVLVKAQYSHNDTTWLGANWETLTVSFDSTGTNYIVGHSYIYADTTAGQIWPAARYVRLLIWQANDNPATAGADTLGVMQGKLILPRAD